MKQDAGSSPKKRKKDKREKKRLAHEESRPGIEDARVVDLLRDALNECASLKADLAEALAELDARDRTIEELERRLAARERESAPAADVTELAERMAGLEAELGSAIASLADAHTANERYAEELARLAAEKDQAEHAARKLSRKLERARRALDDRRIAIGEAGSIAEASLRLAGVFSAAQEAVDLYGYNTAPEQAETGGTDRRKRLARKATKNGRHILPQLAHRHPARTETPEEAPAAPADNEHSFSISIAGRPLRRSRTVVPRRCSEDR